MNAALKLTEDDIRDLEKIEAQRVTKPALAGANAIALVKRVNARDDENWAVAANRETAALSELRGEVIDQPKARRGERRKPIRKLSPIEAMSRAKSLTEPQAKAGERYGVLWKRLQPEGQIRSQLDQTVRGGEYPAEARAKDWAELHKARSALWYDPQTITLLDAVCGRDQSLNEAALGDTRRARRYRKTLADALTELAAHWKIHNP